MKFERYLSYVLIFVMACVVSIGCDKMQKPVMDAMNGGTMDGDDKDMTDPEMETPITYPEPVKENLFYQVETVEHIINSQVYADFLAAPCLWETAWGLEPRVLPLEFPTYEEAKRMIAYVNETEGIWVNKQEPGSSEVYQYFNVVSVRRVCE